RRFGVADEAQQKAGLLVEVETKRGLSFLEADDEIGVVAVDFFARVNTEFLVKRFYVQRKIQVSVDARRGIFGCGHPVHASRHAEPAPLTVEGRDAVAIREMHDREAFVGGLGIDVDREMLAAKGGEGSFFDAAGDFLESCRSADGADVLLEELLGRRK